MTEYKQSIIKKVEEILGTSLLKCDVFGDVGDAIYEDKEISIEPVMNGDKINGYYICTNNKKIGFTVTEYLYKEIAK